MRILTTDVEQLFSYGDTVNPKMFSYRSNFRLYSPIFVLWANLSVYLHCPEDSTPSEQIEGHLPEEDVNGILDDSGKAGAECIAMQMA